jgi:hypothetical protein
MIAYDKLKTDIETRKTEIEIAVTAKHAPLIDVATRELDTLETDWKAKSRELKQKGQRRPQTEVDAYLARKASLTTEITHLKTVRDEEIAALQAPLTAEKVKNNPVSPGNKYAYSACTWTHADWVARSSSVAKGEPIAEFDAIMFVAAMVAEAVRFPISDVANMLILADPTSSMKPIFDLLPMTRGGTITEPHDPNLVPKDGTKIGGGDAHPSGDVTDRSVDAAKSSYRANIHRELVADIDGWLQPDPKSRDAAVTARVIDQICDGLRPLTPLRTS